MADYGSKITDAHALRLNRRIREVYREAGKDIEAKMADFNRRYKVKEAKYAKQVKDGIISQDDFDAWKRGQVFQGEQWKAKRDEIEKVLYNSNSIAMNMVNGEASKVFIANSNYMAYKLEHDAGINFGFNLYDSSTVTRLIKDNPDLLPKWKIREPKDYVWNGKKVNRQITLGIIEGESLEDIAKRLGDNLSTQNMNKMRTFARTAMTGAQNAGRTSRLGEAEGKGIKVHKEWMATLDEVTRTTHRDLDGQKQPVDKPFEVDGYKIRFPGDPTAHPAMVYNCRCTLVGDLDDYPSEYERYDNIEGKPISNMTYREWENAKKGIVTPKPSKPQTSSNKQKFVDMILNSPTVAPMSKEQVDEFKTILNGMSEQNLEMYETMTHFHDTNHYHDRGCWYMPGKRRVEMNLDSHYWETTVGRRNATAAWKDKFHEELHQLDHIIGITQGRGRWSAVTKAESDLYSESTGIGVKLKEAIVGDVLDVINRSIDMVNEENPMKKIKHVTDINKPISRDVKNAFFQYLDVEIGGDKKSKALISPFTDAVGLTTRSRINPYSEGYWGHDAKYQKERGINGATSECFAEVGSYIMREDTEALQAIEDLMPRSIKAYREVLSELATYMKSNPIHY